MTFGDESDFSESEVAEFVDVYDDYGMALDWNPGEAAIVSQADFFINLLPHFK